MKAGDKVTWKSQAGGSWTKKNGTVVAEVPAGEDAMNYLPEAVAKKSYIKFRAVSKRDRALVAVSAGKDGHITHYYCPSKGVLFATSK